MGMFDKAAPVAKPAKSKGKVKAEINLGGDLEILSAIHAMELTLLALKTTADTNVRKAILAHFKEEGLTIGRKPDNFAGTANNSHASCELRARSSASHLTEEELAFCKDNEISTTEIITVPDTFVINPIHVNNAVLMAQVEAALKNIPDFPVDSYFLKQEAVSHFIVDGTGIDDAFRAAKKINDSETADAFLDEALSIVSVTVCGKQKVDDMDEAGELTLKLLKPIFEQGFEKISKEATAIKKAQEDARKKGERAGSKGALIAKVRED